MAKGAKHYLRDGTVWKKSYHKMPNGKLHSGATHTANSKRLFHKDELSLSVQKNLKGKPSGKKKVTKKS